MKTFAVAIILLVAVPSALAEFGPESEDGYPINVNGEVLRPPVLPTPLTHVSADVAAAYGLVPNGASADPVNKVGPFTAYPYYPLLTAEVQRMARDHPGLVKLTSIGKSTAQLDVWMLEIADFANPNMKPLDEREVVYLDGGTHSNEYSGVYFVTEVAQFLLEDYETNETAKWIVENRHTFIIPMVNPDGSNAFGRLNAKGVNVNRNYPVLWNEIKEDPVLNNPGPAAASEVETNHIIDITTRIQPDYAASIHCCGNLWLFPYGVEGHVAPDEPMLLRICDEVYQSVRDVCGPIWSTIYPASGSSVDTQYELVGAAAWGFEMSGRGAIAPWGQPLINADVREQEIESWNGVMHAFLNVHKYGAHPRIVSIEGTPSQLRVTIENEGWGNLTAGNVTLAGATQAIPFLATGQRATLAFDGAFAAGPASLALDWQKRVMTAPQGARTVTFDLTSDGDALTGTLTNEESVGMLSTPTPTATVPAPGLALLVLAVVGLAIARRR